MISSQARVTQESYHHLTPSAWVPAKPILSPRLLFGHRTIILLDLIILLGRWSKVSNERLCAIMVKDTDYGATLLGFKAGLCQSSDVTVNELIKLFVHISSL